MSAPSPVAEKGGVAEVGRSLAERLGAIAGVPIEVVLGDAAARRPSGPGGLVGGSAAGMRILAFAEDSLLRALETRLGGESPGGALQTLSVFAGALVAAVRDAAGEPAPAGSTGDIEEVRLVDAPPAPGDGTVLAVRVGEASGRILLDLGRESESAGASRPSEVLLGLELPFALTLGSVEMELGQVQRLDSGAVVPLGRGADSGVSLVVGGRVVARGELVVIDGCFGLRVTSVETAERRLTTLARV